MLNFISVATVLTVYGIETILIPILSLKKSNKLQQYLPFTVLKRNCTFFSTTTILLQQYLPFTVLKL